MSYGDTSGMTPTRADDERAQPRGGRPITFDDANLKNRTRTSVEHFVGEVNGAARALREEVNILADKLGPLLGPDVPQEQTKPSMDAPSEITSALAQVHDLLDSTRAYVNRIADRL